MATIDQIEGGEREEHLIAVMYLSRPLDRPGVLLASILRGLFEKARLPSARVHAWPREICGGKGDGWTRRSDGQLRVMIGPISATRVDLVDDLHTLPNDADTVIAESLRRGAKPSPMCSWWTLTYQPSGRNAHQHVLDNCLIGVFNTRLFAGQKDRGRASAVVESLTRVIAQVPECYYGHVEISDEEDACGGFAYTTMGVIPGPPLSRRLNGAAWWNARTDRSRCVRGVYWGNYLGPPLARRFDPDGETTARYLAFNGYLSTATVKSDHFITRFDSGGLFIGLTADPMQMSRREHELFDCDIETAAWLHCEFRDRGMLA